MIRDWIAKFKKRFAAEAEVNDIEVELNETGVNLDFESDRPITNEKADLFGFDLIARKLTTAILSGSTSEGLVIGIEGVWGSGKSSILNLIGDHISTQERVTLIKFAPWLIGSRDQMVGILVANLASGVEEVSQSSTGKKVEKAKSLARSLKRYGTKLSQLAAQVLQLAGNFSKAFETAALANDAAGRLLSEESESKELSELKSILVDGLRDLNHRFVVSIDDIDRLEPREVSEIVRLIRAVGDFPNVIYLVCYDKEILAKSLEKALEIENGKDYLQKIVQVNFSVPTPEEFDLRRWFQRECEKLYYSVTQKNIPAVMQDRFSTVCDNFGGLIRTPREVRLVLNSMKLHFPPVANEVDFSDLCFLQIVRTLREDLYKWIENYLVEFAAVQNGAMIRTDARKLVGGRLLKLMPSEAVDSTESIWALTNHILGLEPGHRSEPEKSVFNKVSIGDLTEFESNHRLGSPEHYRLYFSFSKPSGALDNAIVEAIFAAADRDENVQGKLTDLLERERPQGGNMFEVFLDRVSRSDLGKRSKKSLTNLMMGLTELLDDASRSEREPGLFQTRSVWRHARTLLGKILLRLTVFERKIFLKRLFTQGKSIGWLMAEVIGGELFDHGLVGNESISTEVQKLKDDELRTAIKTMHKRLRNKDRGSIIDVPQPLSFLFRWKQSGGEKDVKNWIVEQSVSDVDFLRLVHILRGWSASDKVYHPLNRREVKHFLDYDATVQRLNLIASKSRNRDNVAMAKELLAAVELGKDDV